MGRYDKLKVYNGLSFVKPNRVQVYNGLKWVDCGIDDSDNTETLSVYNGSEMVRATLNKKVVQIAQGSYAKGQFKFLPDNGFCLCANSSSVTNGQFIFEGTIYKETDTNQRIFYSGNSSGTSRIEIWWLSDGSIQVTTAWNGTTNVITSSNKILSGNWVSLLVTQYVGESILRIYFGGTETQGSQYKNFVISNASNYIGSDSLRFKNNLHLKGRQYPGAIVEKTVNMSTANGTDGVNYANVVHYDETKEEIIWE